MSLVQPVRNIEDYSINVQYRFVFFDPSRRPINPDQGWVFKTLPPKVEVPLEGAALAGNAVDWRLEVRPAR